MSRPKTYGDRIALQIRVPSATHSRLMAVAGEREVSVNLLATRAIERLLDEWERLNECPQHFGLPRVVDCPNCRVRP